MDCSGDLRDIPVMPVILSYRSDMNEADEPESSRPRARKQLPSDE